MTTKVTNVYNLKLTPSQFGQSSLVVNCSQYDSLFRVIQFNLYNGNAVYSIPEGSVVTIRGTKKDNTGFEYECDFYNNVVTFPIRDQITIYPGKVPAELRIVNEGEIIGSWNFLFLVEESPLTNDTIISETQLPLLESALQAASEAENYKNLAQQSADNASESEQNASESEANALTYSQNAQTSANSASQSEANALTYSQNASESASEAQGFAQDSEDSATQSADSATSASQSASQAQTIADNIADLVDEAQGYASQSLTNAQNSAQSASQASQSATNASQSATNAQTYASNANQSAQNASSSATSAQTYAGNASTSATQSASSATASAQSATNAQTYASNASASATQAQGYATNASDSATASADSATESQGYAQNASDSATEAQELVDTVEERIANKADIDGVYPKLVAGDLVETETKDDLFTYQMTDHTGTANINSIKGNTLVWNQLVENGNFATDTRWGITGGSKTVANNSLTITANDTNPYITQTTSNIEANHKYLMMFDATCSIRQQFNFHVAWSSGNNANTNYANANTKTKIFAFITPTVTPTEFNIYLASTTVGATAKIENVQIFDLTQMGLDSITSVDEFTKLYPLPYYQYEQHNLLSFNGTGIKTTGKNLLSYSGENLPYNANGVSITREDNIYKIVASNPSGYPFARISTIHYLPKGQYTVLMLGAETSNTGIAWRLIDRNVSPAKLFVNSSASTTTFTLNEDVHDIYFEITIDTSRLTTGTWDVRFQLNIGTPIDYEPYKEETLSLPIAQYFPTGMKSAGSVYDELTESKATTRVGTRAYQSGDENDSTLTTDGTNTNYPLTTPTEADVDLDLSYNTYEGGTEQLLPANTDVPVTSPISMNVEFDFGENLNARFNKVLSMIAPVESAQVSQAYTAGQYLIYDYTLYKVTSNIASGGTITVGTNVTATTLAEILEAL